MLNTQRMIETAEGCLGWPYKSPGTNNAKGIDCSGLFVRMYRDQGADIAHGSNSIFHEHCSETGKIAGTGQLQVGMAVFKTKPWTEKDKDNRWYGRKPGNQSHIGFVCSVYPLRIIHASSVAGKVITDTSISKWSWWGKLKKIAYSGGEDRKMETVTISGGELDKPIRLRKAASTGSEILAEIDQGSQVELIEGGGNWNRIRYNGQTGYVMSMFVHAAGTPDEVTIDTALKKIEEAQKVIAEQVEIIGKINGRG